MFVPTPASGPAPRTKFSHCKKKKDVDKTIFTHITCATDTGNVKFVFNAVVAIILEENLKASGLA